MILRRGGLHKFGPNGVGPDRDRPVWEITSRPGYPRQHSSVYAAIDVNNCEVSGHRPELEFLQVLTLLVVAQMTNNCS